MGTKICSLCMVRLKADNFSKQLVRLADLEGDVFVPIRTDEEGIDRNIIYYPPTLDLPDKHISIFTWEPFFDDGWKQQNIKTISKYWIEVIDRTSISARQLLDEIGTGVDWCDGTHDLLLLSVDNVGIHWPKSQMRSIDGKFTYTTNTKAFCAYQINEEYLRSCSTSVQQDDRKYYATLNLGNISEKLWIFSPEKLISSIISDHIKSFASFSKRDRQNVRRALDNIDNATVLHEIANEFSCEIDTAQRYWDEYITQVEAMLSIQDWDGALFQCLIENDSELSQRMLQSVEDHWKLVNKEFLVEIDKLKQKTITKKDELSVLDEKILQNQQTVNDLEKLDGSLRDQINDRINKARSDIGTLLSDYTWLMPSNALTADGKAELLLTFKPKRDEQTEATESLELAQYNLQTNLGEAGVLEDGLANELAQFLLAAYCSRTNLVVAGIGGLDISTALSAAICCGNPAILNLHNEAMFPHDLYDEIHMCKTDILVVPNALSSSQFDKAIPVFDLFPQKMFIFLTPFADSLAVEPRGLYQYMLPLLTDYYVSGLAGKNYIYADAQHAVADFSLPTKKAIIKAKATISPICSALALLPRQETLIASIRAILDQTCRNNNLNEICARTMYVPLAVSTGKADELNQALASLSLDTDVVDMMLAYLERGM